MARALVIYYSQSGNTRKMAQLIGEAINKEEVEATVKDVKDVKSEEFLNYEAIVVGSPTYYGTMAAQIKQVFDDSVKFHGKLDGKIGAAFASSANIAGGNETTILDICNPNMIMSYSANLEMSYSKDAIMLPLEGGHYGRKGHYRNDSRRIKKAAYNTQSVG